MKEIMREWYASGSEDIKKFEAALDICCKQARREGWEQARLEVLQSDRRDEMTNDELLQLIVALEMQVKEFTMRVKQLEFKHMSCR